MYGILLLVVLNFAFQFVIIVNIIMEPDQDVLIVCKDVLYATMQQFVRHAELDIQLILRKLNAFLIALMLHIIVY